ncbi:hypothetical protein V6N13_147705 [Hibiscus sabdariffa]|uniref:F-box domain-containing protein n=1 Tax=Hibiscus sabdariffa TaxID=183260 RepID=A0ABR2TWA8_9ROSI
MQKQLMVGNGKGNDSGFEFLSNDLLIQMLSRVPVEQLWWKCRLVCKRWEALIPSPYVAHAHLQHATPSTFLVFYYPTDKWGDKLDFFLPQDDDDEASLFMRRAFNGSLVERWKHQTGFQNFFPVASCNGLVLFKRCSTKWRSLGTLRCRVRFGSSPVVLDDTLYWMAENMFSNTPYTECENCIITFSIHNKEFHTMSYPSIRSCKPSEYHRRLNLVAMDGQLTCWYMSGQVADAWVCEGPSNWTWIYRLDCNRNFGMNIPRDIYNVRPVSIQNKKLTLVWPRIGVFRYDLLRNKEEKIELEGIEQDQYKQGHLLDTCYTKSVVSLSNFYPGLSVWEMDVF